MEKQAAGKLEAIMNILRAPSRGIRSGVRTATLGLAEPAYQRHQRALELLQKLQGRGGNTLAREGKLQDIASKSYDRYSRIMGTGEKVEKAAPYAVGIPAATATGVAGLNSLIRATEPGAPAPKTPSSPAPKENVAQKQEQFVQKGSEGKTVADTKETKDLGIMDTIKQHPYATAAGIGIPAALIGGSVLFNRGKKKKPQPSQESQPAENEQEKEAAFLPGWK